jgi:hypothetical protein
MQHRALHRNGRAGQARKLQAILTTGGGNTGQHKTAYGASVFCGKMRPAMARITKENPDVELLRRISASGYTDAIEIMQLIQMVEMGNERPINEHLSKEEAGFAALMIRNSLLTRLHIWVSRAYAPVRKGDLHLRRAFELLKDKKVRREISVTGSEKELSEAEGLWDACLKDIRREPFLHLRHKELAHLGERDAEIALPTYADVFGVSRATAAAMEKLAHGTRVVTVPRFPKDRWKHFGTPGGDLRASAADSDMRGLYKIVPGVHFADLKMGPSGD